MFICSQRYKLYDYIQFLLGEYYKLRATSYGLRVAALYFVGLTTGIPYIYDINYARSFIYAIYYLTIFMND